MLKSSRSGISNLSVYFWHCSEMITAAHPVALGVFFPRDSLLTDKAVFRGFPCLPSLRAVCVFLPPAFITQDHRLLHVKMVYFDNSGKWTDEPVSLKINPKELCRAARQQWFVEDNLSIIEVGRQIWKLSHSSPLHTAVSARGVFWVLSISSQVWIL